MKKVFVLSALLLVLLTGCGEKETFTEQRQVFDAGEIRTITIDVRDREILVSPSNDDQIHLDYTDGQKETYAVSVQNGALTVTLETNKEWTDYFGQNAPAETRILRLALPETTLEELTLSTTNGNMTLPALEAEVITATINNGDFTFDTLDAGESINLTAKNGNITGAILGGYDDFDITCTIKKGDTNLPADKSGGDKTLTVDMNNGDVEIEFVT